MNPDLLFQIQAPPPPSKNEAFQSKNSSAAYSAEHTNKNAHQKDRAAESQDSKDDFAALMKRLQKNRADDSQNTSQEEQADLAVTAFFHRPVIVADDNVKETEALSADTDVDTEALVADIHALSEEIEKLLLQMRDQSDAATEETTLITSETDDREGLLALISFLLKENSDEQGSGNDQDNTNLTNLLEGLRDLLGDDQTDLILSDLTPQQLQDLQAELQALLHDEAALKDLRNLNALAHETLKIVPPETKDTAALSTFEFDPTHKRSDRYDMRYQGDGQEDSTATLEGDDYKSSLKGSQGNDMLGTSNAKATNTSTTQGGALALPAYMLAGDGQLYTLTGADDLLNGAQGAAAIASPGAAGQSGAGLLITQTHLAGQPNPATQTVVATMQKAVKAGQDTNIKLQLDPPELGRVEVKMSFGKDNAAKVVLTAEKPETYMMLQRDSSILQQALQDAGLDADGSSLSFELAQDGHDFGQDNSRGGGHDAGGTGAGGALDDDIIETVMNWQVDPETGHMHYNIMV